MFLYNTLTASDLAANRQYSTQLLQAEPRWDRADESLFFRWENAAPVDRTAEFPNLSQRVVFHRCTFEDSAAAAGGTFYIAGNVPVILDRVLINSTNAIPLATFTGNMPSGLEYSPQDFGFGGALVVRNYSVVLLREVEIHGNSSASTLGGLIYTRDHAELYAMNSYFVNGLATSGGFLYIDEKSTAELATCDVSDFQGRSLSFTDFLFFNGI